MNDQKTSYDADKDGILKLFFKNKQGFIRKLNRKKGKYLNEQLIEYIKLLAEKGTNPCFPVSKYDFTEEMYCTVVTVPSCFLMKLGDVKFYLFLYQKGLFGIKNCRVITIHSLGDKASSYTFYLSQKMYGTSRMYLMPPDSLFTYLYCNGRDFIRRHEIPDIPVI